MAPYQLIERLLVAALAPAHRQLVFLNLAEQGDASDLLQILSERVIDRQIAVACDVIHRISPSAMHQSWANLDLLLSSRSKSLSHRKAGSFCETCRHCSPHFPAATMSGHSFICTR